MPDPDVSAEAWDSLGDKPNAIRAQRAAAQQARDERAVEDAAFEGHVSAADLAHQLRVELDAARQSRQT